MKAFMTFGDAIAALKWGKKVSRTGWNGGGHVALSRTSRLG